MKKYGSDVEIAVYLDVVPDNKNTVKEYNKIKEYLDTLRNHKVVILPIPCMEFIKNKVINDCTTSSLV